MKIVLAILLGVLVLNVNGNPYGRFAKPLSYGASKPATFLPTLPRSSSYGSFVAPKPMLPLPLPPKQVKQSYGSFVPQRPMLPIPQPPKIEQSYGQKIEILPPQKVEQGYGQQQVEILPTPPQFKEQTFSGYGSVPTLPRNFEADLCAGRAVGTKIPHSTNAWQFYVCLEEGEIQLMECPMHLVYHVESEQCENTAKSLPGCSSNPCLNGGICSEFSNKKVSCQCQPGFSGEFCDKTNACDVTSCSGDGICYPQPAGSVLDHICIWERGQKFGIEYPTAEINPCLTNNLGLKTFPSVLSKSVFIHCEGNIPHLKFCPLSSIYLHEAQRCEWETIMLPTSFPTGMEQSYGSGY